MEYKTLFSPMKIGNVEIKNRIAMAPMLMGFGTFNGTTTKTMEDYYEERAKGGAGIIFTEIARVNDIHGAAAFAQLGVSQDYQIESLKRMATKVQKHGSKIFVQIHHPGRQNLGLLVGTIPLCVVGDRILGKKFGKMIYKVAPTVGKFLMKRDITLSVVAPSKVPRSYFADSRMRALRNKEIKKLIEEFGTAALRVKKAGCDGVMLHASHGYLIQQFLSPYTNRRTDEYGGSFENRMRFLQEIIASVRQKCGDFPIVVRLTVDECYDRIGQPEKGYRLEEGVKIAIALEKMGVDAIDVSSSSYDTFNFWLEPTTFECGWRKYMTKAVKDAVKIPVLGANLIRSPQQAEKQLVEGYQDFVSLGRPHIADPHWSKKVAEGKSKNIKRCISCLYCIESMQNNAYVGGHGGCAVNPLIGKEGKFTNGIIKDGNDRLTVVIGGGVAGLTAAEWLLRRGFKVILLEKSDKLGGQVLQASHPLNRKKLNWSVKDLAVAVEELGGDIRLNTIATLSTIKELDPYAVFVATGGEPIRPKSIKGIDAKNVLVSSDVLGGGVSLKGAKIAIIGSGMTGLEVAEELSGQNDVFIIEGKNAVAEGTWMQHIDDTLPKLKANGVKIYLNEKLVEIDGNTLTTENTKTGEKATHNAHYILLALGIKSENDIASKLKEEGRKNVFVIGDAKKGGRIADATNGAFDAVMSLR